jgi:hypothetical protein
MSIISFADKQLISPQQAPTGSSFSLGIQWYEVLAALLAGLLPDQAITRALGNPCL